MPCHDDGEAPERVGVDRLDLLPQPGERPPAEAAQDVGVDPFALGAARPELAFDQPACFASAGSSSASATATPRP